MTDLRAVRLLGSRVLSASGPVVANGLTIERAHIQGQFRVLELLQIWGDYVGDCLGIVIVVLLARFLYYSDYNILLL